MAKRRKRRRRYYTGYDWLFAPLYGPWAAISTAYPAQSKDPPTSPAYPGEGGINSPDVPAGTNAGQGPVESTMKLNTLTEGLAHMDAMLGGLSNDEVTSMFFDEMPLVDPDEAKASGCLYKASDFEEDPMSPPVASVEVPIEVVLRITVAQEPDPESDDEMLGWLEDFEGDGRPR